MYALPNLQLLRGKDLRFVKDDLKTELGNVGKKKSRT